ncbi:maleylpyruvate isomerase N-terminal domain-containing protein [Kitasatospora sp. NPDC088548]|uniref:maleylpyruvate isomerase N-terminal domain-containing protein n=1 Tax=Kitasatospora sp. NPDC088548 TaxID=3364075 RepID=UPI0037FD915D
MPHHIDHDLALLTGLWESWAERGAALDPQGWGRPTRLPGWSVQDLYAHVAPDPAQFAQLRGAVVDAPAAVDSGAGILRAYNRPGGLAHTAAERIAESARQTAGATEPAALVARFATEGPAALAAIADLPPATVIAHPLLGAVTIGALREVAVMEATVHLLDLIAAIGGPPPATAALHATRTLLAEVADPVAFIEAATGRTDTPVLPVVR